MDPIAVINSFVPFLIGVSPAVGKVVVSILAVVVALPVGVSGAVTGLVTIWHGVVAFLTGLAAIPGLGKLSGFVEKLQADTAAIESGESRLLAIVNRLSGINLPQSQAQPAAPAAAQAAPTQGA